MTLEGVDIASHQGPNFAYPEGTAFAIIKASGGHAYRNEYLAAQVAGARTRGIAAGFYHYMFEPTAGGGDVKREAVNFIEACRPHVQVGSTFWLDVEEFPERVGFAGDLGGWIVDFCEQVERAFGCVCGIYCATWYLEPTGLWLDGRLTKYPFWMASWQEAVPHPKFMAPWNRLTVHQYNAQGWDKDRFYGTLEQYLALGVRAPEAVPTPDPIVARSYIDADGVPTTEIKWGGRATEVLGTSYVDIGIHVVNAAGDTYHRSIVNGEGREYVKEG
jgi:hypothetical protein